MQRSIVISVIILIVAITISIFILNIMKEPSEKMYPVRETEKSPSNRIRKSEFKLGEFEKPKEITHATPTPPKEEQEVKEAVKVKEPEYDLSEIPSEEVKKIETKKLQEKEAVSEEGIPPERTPNTQPSRKELEELKMKGVIIY